MNDVWVSRRGIFLVGLTLAVAAGLGADVRSGDDPVPTKSDRTASTPRSGGSLVIGGGGRLPDEVYGRFIELAGGKAAKLVLIPTARSPDYDGVDPADELKSWTVLGVASVRMLHTRSRATANDPTFAATLADATGVWIGGGWQSRLSEAYAGTEVERQLRALLDRGGVIGGSSAGAAIMTRVMIADGQVDPVEGRGFDLLPNAVVDQHFLKRNRVERLTRLLKRHPDLIGFGIDEGTALVVDLRARRIDVMGDSTVLVCHPASEGHPARTEVLKRGDHRTDLAAISRRDAPGPPK